MSDQRTERRGRPLWRWIADDLNARIDAGEFVEQFPGEVLLAAQYGVSRGTIRSALRPIREHGRVSAGRGRHPQVTSRSGTSSYGPIYSLYETVRDDGLEQASVVLTQAIVTAPEVGRRLGLPFTTEFFHFARTRYADAHPLAVDQVWITATLALPLKNIDFTNTAGYKELRDVCGVTLDGGTEEVWAVPAESAQTEALECEVGEPLFKIHRIGYHQGVPAEFRETFILGSRFSITRSFGPPTDA